MWGGTISQETEEFLFRLHCFDLVPAEASGIKTTAAKEVDDAAAVALFRVRSPFVKEAFGLGQEIVVVHA